MWLFEALTVLVAGYAVSLYLLLLFWGVVIFGMRAREIPALAWSMVVGWEQQNRLQAILAARKGTNAVR
jgi:hypothetical protein